MGAAVSIAPTLSRDARQDKDRSNQEQNALEFRLETRKKHLALPRWNHQTKRFKRSSCTMENASTHPTPRYSAP
jgi:hypothetical protein